MITNAIIIISIIIFILINFIDKSNYDKTSLAIKYGAFDIMHIFMNVYCIYNLGHFFEYLLGTGAYLYLIFISCLATSGACYYHGKKYAYAYNTVTLGASGIFYGYLGAMIALGILVGGYFDYMLQQYIYVILINVAFTFFNRQVSKAGHFGGLAGGFLATAMLIGCGVWHF